MFYEVRAISNIAGRSAEIGAVIRLAFADVAEEFHLTPTNCPKHPSFLPDSDIIEQLSRPGVICFGALANDTLVGFVSVWPKRRGAYELTRLCVLPEHRHAGLGAGLLQAAVQAAEERGARKIEIGVIAENERLKCWYGRHGFRATAVRAYARLPFAVCEMALEV
ncbi:MAG: GNAT family N-acetyltransferase [Oscillospiraceae bacterium]|jgi:ribosomal protein S18 acetylase RimI-like enzyme|nr:GNAT family N-acetyltransferase [Oscillospiraceae bacterium]